FEYSETSRAPKPTATVAGPEGIAEAAKVLAAARRPLIVVKAAGRDPAAVASLVALAEALGAPVVDQFHTHMNFPQHHDLHGGFDATPYLDEADAIAIVESDVPWFPSLKAPRSDARLIQIATDPLFSRYPIRGFGADVALPGTHFGSPSSGGLGWGVGAALGARLAKPDHTVICTVGDGAYIFGAPTAAHWVARAYDIPVLWIVFNNRAWNAVKRAVTSHAPDGWAKRTGMPLTELDPPPDYEMVCHASGGWAEKVEDPAALPDALRRALSVVRDERRQALLNVICKKP